MHIRKLSLTFLSTAVFGDVIGYSVARAGNATVRQDMTGVTFECVGVPFASSPWVVRSIYGYLKFL